MTSWEYSLFYILKQMYKIGVIYSFSKIPGLDSLLEDILYYRIKIFHDNRATYFFLESVLTNYNLFISPTFLYLYAKFVIIFPLIVCNVFSYFSFLLTLFLLPFKISCQRFVNFLIYKSKNLVFLTLSIKYLCSISLLPSTFFLLYYASLFLAS